MTTLRKRHRETLRAMRFSRSSLKLTFLFGAVVFAAMAVRIILIEFPEAGFEYAELVRDIIIVTSGVFALFLVASAVIVLFIYYSFKKHHISMRLFRVKDLILFNAIEIVVLLVTAYMSYMITVTE